jgi:long-chain fatty acid transport protein
MNNTSSRVRVAPTTRRTLALTAIAAALAASLSANATNGYFPHGFGLKAKGMGGASIALTHDAFGGVNNPAATAFGAPRMDVGLELFNPKRDAQFVGLSPRVESGKNWFPIPEFGYTARGSDTLSWGITVYGNGGMNTSYGTFPNGSNLLNPMPNAGKLGVDLMQLIIAPHLAWKAAPEHAFGIAPLVVAQRFEAYGIQSFAGFSARPGAVSNRGKDTSSGVGVRLGYLGRLTPQLSVGLSYSPRTRMSRFEKYEGLFAGAGDFDIPENYGIGLAFEATPGLTFAADFVRIRYSAIPSIGNASLSRLFAGQPLGGAQGPGFGWSDVDVVKIGAQWRMDERWTFRAGFNRGENPVGPADAMFNILAPGVIRTHYTVGATYAPDRRQEFTFALWHGKREDVTGVAVDFMTNQVNPTGTRIGMRQNGLGMQYSLRF